MSNDVAGLAMQGRNAELVLALVSPLGTPLDGVQRALSDALAAHGYRIGALVRISYLLSEMAQIEPKERPEAKQERLMEMGNALRRHHGGDYLALTAITHINASRDQDGNGEVLPQERRAHVIRSLKHPDEVTRLRHVYKQGLFLLGVSAPRRLRLKTLLDQNFPLDEANRLLDKDAAEEDRIGQQTRDTFELSDAFLWVDRDEEVMRRKVLRIIDLLMSCPFHPPTRQEHAMFMAYASALSSSDLSRQVGAVVTNREGDMIATGANDAPAFGGGTYWPTRVGFDYETKEDEGPDYLRGYDSNERERNKILARVIEAIVPEEAQRSDLSAAEQRRALVDRYKNRLKGTGLLDLTEFGRAVHAEMAALLSCARSGISPVGGTLYCTTFPCHNCAKHIIAAGIASVVYVEPYPKSRAKDLHGEAISLPNEDDDELDGSRVEFKAFEGVGP
ncbi:MAG: anti-phage dCTP deaminase, partial [Nannocystaceae bacterium]